MLLENFSEGNGSEFVMFEGEGLMLLFLWFVLWVEFEIESSLEPLFSFIIDGINSDEDESD